jgi:hypothetical protein
MTGPVPHPPEDWSGGEPPGSRIALGRALVLLVVAVVVGILCLQVGARPPGPGAVNGAAGFFTSKLQADGWTTLTPANATPVTASGVYYATGQQASAAEVASEVGLASSAVHPIATAPPVQGTTGAGVLLVVGPDLSSKVTSGSTSGTSTSTTTSTG